MTSYSQKILRTCHQHDTSDDQAATTPPPSDNRSASSTPVITPGSESDTADADASESN